MKNTIYILFLVSLFLIPQISNAQVNKQDSLALVDLYNNANGPNWGSNWLTGNRVIHWHGISLKDGRVTMVMITHNKAKGEIPASIGNLTELETLYITSNLSGEIPTTIGNLSKLTTLNLYSNDLSGEIPETIGNLLQLTELNLSSNNLRGEIPEAIGNLSSLKELKMGNDSLSGSIPTSIGNLSLLNHLYLTGNELSGEIPSSIGGLTELNQLYLTNNKLSGGIPDTVYSLTSLERLHIDYNNLNGEIPEAIGNLTSLVALNFGYNNLTGEIPEAIGNLTALTALDFSENNLTGEIPETIGNLSALKDLELHGNDLSGNMSSAIAKLSNLYRLNLSSNGFNFGNLEPLAEKEISIFIYAPQDTLELIGATVEDSIKFTFENAGGTQTIYNWQKESEIVEGYYNKKASTINNNFTIANTEDITKWRCLATNSSLEYLKLVALPPEELLIERNCWKTGSLTFCLNSGKWEKGSGTNKIKASDVISINDFLYFDGTMTVDTSALEIDANGEFYVTDIPLPGGSFGKYTLSQGEYNLKLLGSDGKLTNFLNSKLEKSAELFGVGLNMDDLQLVMKHDTVGLKIGCTIAVPGVSGSCEGSGDTDIKINGLEITNAGISLGGVEIKDLGLFVDGYCLKDLSINYDSKKDILISGMQLALPFGEVGGGFKLEEGLIDSIAWNIESTYAPFVLGSTTIGIKGFFGHISNITKPAIEVELGGIFSDIISDDLYRIEASGKTVWPTYFEVKGTGQFLRPIFDDLPFQLHGEVALSYKIPNNLFAMEFGGKFGTIDGKDWLLKGKGNLKLGLNSDPPIISGMLNGAVSLKKLPDYLPYSAFNQTLDFPIELQSANCLIIGKNELFFGTTSFQYGLFGPYSIKYTVDLSKRSDDEDYVVYQVDKGTTKSGIISEKSGNTEKVTKTFVIPENTELAAIEINSQGTAPASLLTDNTGKKYTSSSSTDNVLNIKSSDSKQSFWLITSPKVGTWSVSIENPVTSDTIITYFQLKEKDFNFSMNQTENTVTVSWDVAQVEEGQTVNLMLDDDNTDFDGFRIAEGQATLGRLNFTLDENTPDCNYYLFVQLIDENSVVQAYAEDKIGNPFATLAPPENLSSEYNSETGEFNFTWTENPTSEITGYILSVTDELGNDSVYAILNSSQTNISLFIEDFETKSAKIEAYNQDWKIGCPTTSLNLTTSIEDNFEINEPDNKLNVFPNPATGSCTIRYFVSENSNCEIRVFDIQGREIARPLHEFKSVGFHQLNFEYGQLPNGIYIIKFINEYQNFTVKSILSK